MRPPRVMLAASVDLARLKFPVYATPKIDGVRVIAHQGQALSRTLKPIPNRYVQRVFKSAGPYLEGLDGELVVGSPTDPSCYANTVSGVMSQDGEPDFTFYVFDRWNAPNETYERRMQDLEALAITRLYLFPEVSRLHYREVPDIDHLQTLAHEAIDQQGYEGLILRGPDTLYKYGRSTVREGGMLKLKVFEDSEAVVLSVVEEMHNTNEASLDARGYTQRSTAAAGLQGKGRAGALEVRDLTTGVEFSIGTGLDSAARDYWWTLHGRGQAAGRIVKYKFFPVGVKDKPRHPVYLGERADIDMGGE